MIDESGVKNMENNNFFEIKKVYQEIKEKYTQDEIIECMFIGIRVIDEIVGSISERIEKLESNVKDIQQKINFYDE